MKHEYTPSSMNQSRTWTSEGKAKSNEVKHWTWQTTKQRKAEKKVFMSVQERRRRLRSEFYAYINNEVK